MAKEGLALSAFGAFIVAWGNYLRWWTFCYLVVWAWFIVRDLSLGFHSVREGPPGLGRIRFSSRRMREADHTSRSVQLWLPRPDSCSLRIFIV